MEGWIKMKTGIKKVLIMNSYIIGTVIIILGYIWMITIAVIGGDMVQTMVSFFFTISGIGFWAIGYYLGGRQGFTLKRQKHTTDINKLVLSSRRKPEPAAHS